MKKIITTIILALLTSPVFADFKFGTIDIAGGEQVYTALNNSTDGSFIFGMLNYRVVFNHTDDITLSSKYTELLISFDGEESRICSYVNTGSLFSLNSESCIEWVAINMTEKNNMLIRYTNPTDEIFAVVVPLKGFRAAYKKVLILLQ